MAIAAVRAAASTDVDEIARIQADTWAAAYSALVPPAAVEQLRGPEARRAWAAAVDAVHVLLAAEGEWTVGFVAAAVAEPPDITVAEPPDITVAQPPDAPAAAPPDAAQPAGAAAHPVEAGAGATGRAGPSTPGAGAWGEIGTLLVEPRWGRRGHGGRLLAAAAEVLRAGGARYGLAWVPEADEASRRFYARAGWEPDGAVRAFDTGDGTLREVRLTGSLDLKLQH